MVIAPLATDQAAAAVELWREAGLTRPWNDPMRLYAALGYGHDDVVVLSQRLR
jgi:hypothetical protein